MKMFRFAAFTAAIAMVLTFSSCDMAFFQSSDTGISEQEKAAQEAFASSNAENDTDVGLKNIKIDTAEGALTDGQKAVLEYFDDDYLTVPSYEFLRRYPGVFTGAQVKLWGAVKKVISMDDRSYKIVLWLGIGHAEYEDPGSFDLSGYNGAYIILEGKTADKWYMEGDILEIYGRYTGVETIDIDGTSYTIPKVSVYSAFFDASHAPKDIYRYIQKFDTSFIKTVAKTIFGDDIEVRKPVADIDVSADILALWSEVCPSESDSPCFVVEPENQSNAKFTKFFFFTSTDPEVWGGERIEVAKDSTASSSITRSIEFAADFSHFFMFTYDTDLETLTLEYYDSSLQKIWKREFEETTNALYDYTKNNIYLSANNQLYIINIETGKDTYAPSYIGEKTAVRKLTDGILLISKSKSDGIMKTALNGKILWTANLASDVSVVNSIQIVNGSIVAQLLHANNETHYIVLNNADGSIVQDAVSMS